MSLNGVDIDMIEHRSVVRCRLNQKSKEILLEQKYQALEEYKKSKKHIIDFGLKLPGVRLSKFIYPFTKFLLVITSTINGEKIRCMHKEGLNIPPNRTIIYANTHRFKPDFEKITMVTDSPSIVLASDFINSYKTINGWYLNTRPTIFVDPYDKADRQYSYKMMVSYCITKTTR